MRFLLLGIFSLFLLQCSRIRAPEHRTPAASTLLDKSGYLFDPSDRSCDGFPRLTVQTMPGTCLGMVLPQGRAESAGVPWKMPRTIQQIPGTKDFLIVDMGGWAENRGSLYLMSRKASGEYGISLVKGGLNMPHALLRGPGGFFYLGETDKVWRFNFSDGKLRDWQLVVAKLPRYKGYMHPLVALAFDPRNDDMFINSGAPSDHCFVKNHESYSDCPEDTEAGLAVIFRVPGAMLKNLPTGGVKIYEVAAKGLRNSMAMEVHSSGVLVQGENGRDFPQLEEPYEEMNAVDLADDQRGKHFGWPYCFDFHGVSPEWKFSQNLNDPLHKRFSEPVNCAAKAATEAGTYQPPYILFPPHVAPLHLGYYKSEGQLAPLLKDRLLVVWHGYQPPGHRIVAYKVNERGLPVTTAVTGKETYSFDVKGGCPTQKPFKAEGGVDRFAPYTEVISQWDEVKGIRPKGAPVSYTVADDGSLFIVEDKNHTVVRLAGSDHPLPSNCSGGGNTMDPRIEELAWRNLMENNSAARAGYEGVRDNVLKKYCASCHGGFVEKEIAEDKYSELDYMVKNEFFLAKKSLASKLYQALSHSGEVPAMPPADVKFPEGAEGADLVKSVKNWIDALPGIEGSVKKTAMKESRKIRAQASASAKECGSLSPGDIIYLDPRPESLQKKDGWLWAKVYFVPGDTRLFKNGCSYPVDGAFYVATTKQ